MKITLEQIKEALEHGYSVEIVINGEYYDIDETELIQNEED